MREARNGVLESVHDFDRHPLDFFSATTLLSRNCVIAFWALSIKKEREMTFLVSAD